MSVETIDEAVERARQSRIAAGLAEHVESEASAARVLVVLRAALVDGRLLDAA